MVRLIGRILQRMVPYMREGVIARVWGAAHRSRKGDEAATKAARAEVTAKYLFRKALAVRRAEWTAQAKAPDGEWVDVAETHPLAQFLASPHPEISWSGFVAIAATHLDVFGRAYLLIVEEVAATGQAVYIDWLHPAVTKVIRDPKTSMVVRYEYGRGPSPPPVIYQPEQVIPIRWEDPFGACEGWAPAGSLITSSETATAILNNTAALFENECRPPWVATVNNLPKEPEAYEKVRDRFLGMFGGRKNAGKGILLEGNESLREKIEPLGWNPRETSSIQFLDTTERAIARSLGFTDGWWSTQSSRAEAVEHSRRFVRDAVLPALNLIAEQVNARIAPGFGPGLRVVFEDPMPHDAFEVSESAQSEYQAGLITLNEAREKLGYDPIEEEVEETQEDDSDSAERAVCNAVDCAENQSRVIVVRIETEIPDELFYDRQEFREALSNAYKEHAGDMLGDGWREGLEQVEFSDPFSVTNPKVNQFIDDYSFKFASKVNESFPAHVRGVMAEAAQEGQTLSQIRDNLRRGYKDAGSHLTRLKADMISATEMNRASTRGRHMAWEESGEVEAVKWDAFPDMCPWCSQMDGRTVSLGEAFFEQGSEFNIAPEGEPPKVMRLDYETVEGPPLHPFCRCATTAVLVERSSFAQSLARAFHVPRAQLTKAARLFDNAVGAAIARAGTQIADSLRV